MAEIPAPEPARQTALADSVLLIDGDNDPHLPPDFTITANTLVRVFLRPGAKMPRPLERRLEGLPLCITVVSPKGGANAADFVMSMHTGILHSTLPLHLPFTIVTHDKSLAVMVEELQRVGRQAVLWTSHPERSAPRARAASSGRAPSRRRRSSPRPAPVAAPAPPPPSAALAAEPAAAPLAGAPQTSGSLVSVAAAYAHRLGRIKDPPSRLKTLLNDITHRTGNSGLPAEAILEELKRSHGVTVDAAGHVLHPGPAAAPAEAPAAAAAAAPRPHRRRRRRR